MSYFSLSLNEHDIEKILANAIWMNQVEYKNAWDIQKQLFEARKKQEIEDTIVFLEHPHTITMGKTASEANLLLDDNQLVENKIHLEYIDRGGDITYHGPGQLVVYPIFDLNQHFRDVHKYLRVLEDVVIDMLKKFNLESGRIEGMTGVWIGSEKICAIGVKVSRWITMHGIAINVNTDLSYFNHIIPCGISDKNVTSLEKILGRKVEMEEVIKFLLESFKKLFNLNINTTSYHNIMNGQ